MMNSLPPKPFNWPLLIFGIVLILTIICLVYLQLPFGELLRSGENITEYLSRYTRPDFSEFPKYLWLMMITVAIAFWGTILALSLSFFLAPIAAKNLSPHPLSYRIAREILNFFRAMPDLVLALVFVAALGLGPLPGFLALGIHTTGFLGKFLAESMERVDKGVYEGVSATGTNTLQLILYAAWPSILQEAIGYTLYIFDRNVRMATVLGLVGAGGIGVELNTNLRFFNYEKAATLMLIILFTIVAIDYLSTWLRKQVL
ncbi:phosphonate ABC transporter, permease protein PhnE [Crocosphaera chwakensis]|nr:phosphonate ABC transporter, permease protein PhnE [Crocosphaera chwakensis]